MISFACSKGKPAMDKATVIKLVISAEKEAIDRGRTLTMQVVGFSMFPLLATGDGIEINSCTYADIKAGDMVCFRVDAMTCHRVMLKFKAGQRRYIVTKGDTSLKPDKPVPAEAVMGRVTVVRKGSFMIPLENMSGRIISLFLLVLSLSYALPVSFFVIKKWHRILSLTKNGKILE